MRRSNWRVFAGVTLVLSVAGHLVSRGIPETGAYYRTSSEIVSGTEQNGRNARISGRVVDGTMEVVLEPGDHS